MAVVRQYRNGLKLGTHGGNPTPPPRGVITGWSPGAVRRHTTRLYSVESSLLEGSGFALTLTLRDSPQDHDEWRRLLRAWFRYVELTPGFVRLHWVVEWQARGVPHLHVAVYGHDWDRRTSALLVHAWLDVTAHLGSRWGAQDVEPIDGALGWLRYLSKHAARGVAHYQRQGMPPGWEKTGRLYGFRGSWPFCDPEEVSLSRAGGHRMRRLVRSWRIANARAALLALPPGSSPAAVRQARRRIGSARRALSSSNRRLSDVRGVSEWIPEHVGLALLAILDQEGHTIRESAEEARTRVLGALPSPDDVEGARLGAALDLMADLGFVEVLDA